MLNDPFLNQEMNEELLQMQKNVLSWYSFEEGDEILEIGGGQGIITGFLCEKGCHVDVLELSDQKAEDNRKRNQFADRLTIINDSFKNFSPDKKYDYVVIIGTLKYADSYMEEKDAYAKMLCKASGCLKPNGQLILAIENRFGMKYWAGAKEDHTGAFFEGLEGYENSNGVRTFTKIELVKLLENTGYRKIDFYYPLPDYKISLMIYSDEYLPKPGEIRGMSISVGQERVQLFKEELVFDSVCRDGTFDYFANSFLVFAKQEG